MKFINAVRVLVSIIVLSFSVARGEETVEKVIVEKAERAFNGLSESSKKLSESFSKDLRLIPVPTEILNIDPYWGDEHIIFTVQTPEYGGPKGGGWIQFKCTNLGALFSIDVLSGDDHIYRWTVSGENSSNTARVELEKWKVFFQDQIIRDRRMWELSGAIVREKSRFTLVKACDHETDLREFHNKLLLTPFPKDGKFMIWMIEGKYAPVSMVEGNAVIVLEKAKAKPASAHTSN